MQHRKKLIYLKFPKIKFKFFLESLNLRMNFEITKILENVKKNPKDSKKIQVLSLKTCRNSKKF